MGIPHKIIFFDLFSLTMRMLINAEEGTSKANKTIKQLVREASNLGLEVQFYPSCLTRFSLAKGFYWGNRAGYQIFSIASKTLTQTLNLV